ncbi:MAG: hypothetical protein AABY18_06000 [Candidatus Thermoplasmatota archaeon]
MKVTFDLAPRIFLAIGVVLLVVAGASWASGGGNSLIAIALGAVFVLIAGALAIAPDKPRP